MTGRKKEARRRKRRGGRTALNPEVVAVAAEALVEASELGQFGPSFGPDSSFAKTGFSPSDGKGEHSCTQK